MKKVIHAIEAFQKWSNEALIEANKHKESGDSYREALQFGVHTAYSIASEHLAYSLKADQAEGEIVLGYKSANVAQWLHGKPAFIEQSPSSQSTAEKEAEGRFHNTPRRVNHHE